MNVSRSVDASAVPGASRPTRRRGCLIAACVVVAASIAAFFAVWWWLSPKGPWVAPLRAAGCQGVSLDRPQPAKGHDLRCSVFTPGRIAPGCERIVTTYTEAGGPTNGSGRVIVNENGQERVACAVGGGRAAPAVAYVRSRVTMSCRRAATRRMNVAHLGSVTGSSMLRRLGIDPAPGKGLVVFDPGASEGRHFQRVDPRGARAWLAKERSVGPMLVGWDAPLVAAFDQTYTERPIERLLKDQFGPAVSVRGFSGCPHWTISLDVLGRPLPASVYLADNERLPLRFPNDHAAGEGVVETHPAVALALLWPEGDDLPIYKPKADVSAAVARANVRRIEDYLKVCAEAVFGVPWVDLPEKSTRRPRRTAERDVFDGGVGLDDLLDAQVSYLCVEAMVAQKAVCLGDPSSGYFAVPRTPKADAWQARFDQMAAEERRRSRDHAGRR